MSESEQQPHRAADELIASLKEGGTEVASGEFTLDRDVAREKLREYQLPDRRFYLLKLAQAAVRQGATRVQFRIDPGGVRVDFDGDPFTVRDFERLYSELFTSAAGVQRQGLHSLAIGLNAAMSLEPRAVRVRSGDGEQGAELLLRPRRDDEFKAAQKPLHGTQIEVESPRAAESCGPETDAAEGGDRRALIDLLWKRCQYASIVVEVQGKVVSGGPTIKDGRAHQVIAAPDITGRAAFTAELPRRSEVRFLMDGIWVSTRELGGLPDGFLAVVEGARLRMDISESGILQDEAYAAVWREVEQARKGCMRALANALGLGKSPAGFDANWARRVIRQALWPASDLRSYRGTFHDRLAVDLAVAPLWNALFRGHRETRLASLEELLTVIEQGGSISYALVPNVVTSQAVALVDRPQEDVFLVLESPGDERFLQRLVGDGLVHRSELEPHIAEAEQRRLAAEAAEQSSGMIAYIAISVLVVILVVVLVFGLSGCTNRKQRCTELYDRVAECAPEGQKPSRLARREFIARCQQDFDKPEVKRTRACVKKHEDCESRRKCIIKAVGIDKPVKKAP
ncbi:MAG: hypothetical protein ABI333_15480 [bacterium]